MRNALPLLVLLATAAPALAGGTTAIPIPEPGDAMLFLMGVGGVAIGRWMHARRARRDGTKKDGE